MNREELIKNLTSDELVSFCNDIYDWHHGNGDLDRDSTFSKFFQSNKESFYGNISVVEDMILQESYNRFHKTAKILIVKNPNLFIK